MAYNHFQAKAAHDEMKHAMKEQRLHAKAGNALAHGKVFKAVKLEAKAAGESMKKEMAHSRAAGGPFGHTHHTHHHHPHHHHHHHHHQPVPNYPGAPGYYPGPPSGPAYPTGNVAPPSAAYPPQNYPSAAYPPSAAGYPPAPG